MTRATTWWWPPDGATALHLLAAQTLDVILLDMKMPETDGWAFAAQYAQQEGDQPPIIVVTAARDAAQRAHPQTKDIPIVGMSAGERLARIPANLIDDQLAKPFGLDDLYAVVERWAPLSR